MVKRRRERDRPKAGPETAYNPHKRVHLSYGEDDEPEEDAASLDGPPPVRYPVVAAQPDPPQHTPSVGMTPEQAVRSSTSDTGGEGASAAASQKPSGRPDKREKKANANPGKNESTNQKPALGSLSYQWEGSGDDEEGDMSEEDEAMAYLKAVRLERQGMPIVLRAVETTSEDDIDYGVGDSRGYFVEDCYIARPVLRPEAPKKTTVSAKEAYTEALKRRFDTMRTRLGDVPPAGGQMAQTDSNKPVLRPNGGKRAYADCVDTVQKSSPSLSQLQALDQEDTLSMLELIQKSYFKRGETLGQHTSAWIWALLAKLGDVGMMNNDEVFVLRDLGKRALVVQISFNDAAMAAQLEEISRAEDITDEVTSPGREGSQTTVTADHQTDAAGSSVIPMLDPESTLATLDMIVTIVGEFFGQRDLLDSRRSWDPEV